MYALQLRHQDRKYFHIRKEICPFIESHYELLVPKTSIYPFHYSLVIPLSHQLTESISWRQTVNMTLSHPQYAHIFMQESQDHEHGRRKGNTHHYHNSLSYLCSLQYFLYSSLLLGALAGNSNTTYIPPIFLCFSLSLHVNFVFSISLHLHNAYS